MARKNEFLNLIQKQRDTKKTKRFEGTFLEYLELVKDKPESIKLAHKRLYETIKDRGIETLDVDSEKYRDIFNGDKIRTYDYFEKEFFGMESVINKLMRFLKSAAFKGEESRQVLLLMGPVGAGKSALIDSVKRALEDAEEYYYLDGCPVREEPLHLLPRSL